jgi:RNA ligase (TIGR02306 family)
MSKFSVPVLRLASVEPHPNADRLDYAVIGGYRAVVAKNAFKAGDLAIYIPTDAVVPPDVAERFGIAAHLTGEAKNRVHAVKLRGLLSEGIVLPVSAVPEAVLGHDLAAALGITKFEEVIPPELMGRVREWPSFLPGLSIENIKHPEFKDIVAPGTPVFVTEKFHGMTMIVALGPGLHPGEEAYVCGSERALVEEDTSPYWRATRKYKLIPVLHDLSRLFAERGVVVDTIALYGEWLGGQHLKYGFNKGDPGFVGFGLRVNGDWIRLPEVRALFERVGVPMPTLLYEGPFDYAALLPLAEGRTTIGGAHVREGWVLVPQEETFDPRMGRVALKCIGDGYLGAKGPRTDYH